MSGQAVKRLAEIRAEQKLIDERLDTIEAMADPEGTDDVVRAALTARDTESDDLIARFKALDTEAEPLVRRAQELADIKAAAKDQARVEDGDGARWIERGPNFHKQIDPFEGNLLRLTKDEVVTRSRHFIENEKRVHVTDANRARLDQWVCRALSDDPDDPDYSFDGAYIARRALLTENSIYRKAFRKYSAGKGPWSFTAEEMAALNDYEKFEAGISRAANENTGSAGGFGVPILIDPSIILTSGAADVPLLRVCRVETVTNNLWEGVSTPGMTWSYSTESTEASDNTPTLSQPTVRVHKPQGFLPYSLEIGQDYPGFANEFGRLIDQSYQDLLASITMTGTGTNQPFGIFVALSNATSVTIPTTDGAFGGADVFKVWNALPERYRGNATWVMSVNVQSAIRQFAANQSLAQSAYFTIDLSGGQFRLNDRPVIITDYAPTGVGGSVPGTTGLQNILAVADWQQTYLWVNRAGMSIEQIPMLFGNSNRFPTGQRGLYAWARNGGNVVNQRGGQLLQNQ
jgi:HK97 family phage major capsid protein